MAVAKFKNRLTDLFSLMCLLFFVYFPRCIDSLVPVHETPHQTETDETDRTQQATPRAITYHVPHTRTDIVVRHGYIIPGTRQMIIASTNRSISLLFGSGIVHSHDLLFLCIPRGRHSTFLQHEVNLWYSSWYKVNVLLYLVVCTSTSVSSVFTASVVTILLLL